MEPYQMHDGTDLRYFDGKLVHQIAWIRYQPSYSGLCCVDDVILKIKDENSITLLGDSDFFEWFREMHSGTIQNSEIRWVHLP